MKVVLWAAALTVTLLYLVGCDQGGPTETRAGQPVPIIQEYTGQQGPFTDRGFLVVQRPEAWQALWGTRPAPAVDFTQQSVLVALMGQQPTAGYGIRITDVRATGTRILAYVDETRPRPGDMVAQVITYPYDMVVVPKLTQPVAFDVDGAATIAVQDLYLGAQSLATTPQTLVIRDQTAWQSFWRTRVNPQAVVPAVDFNQYMAVVAMSGTRPTTGYTVMITGVEERASRLEVRYRALAPPAGTTVVPTPTSPFAVALIPASTQAVAFVPVTTPIATAAAPAP